MTSENLARGSTTTSHLSSCNPLLKLGDTCDVCHWGIMLPPGGVAYYEELAKESNPRAPHGHEKLVCPRCGHWHISMGPGFSSGLGKVEQGTSASVSPAARTGTGNQTTGF
jgi:hypothetical protein